MKEKPTKPVEKPRVQPPGREKPPLACPAGKRNPAPQSARPRLQNIQIYPGALSGAENRIVL
ncbi:MAG: hypothetical protein PHD67_07400 [Oscillospiraceae bacterium]|nr:hypothetical protein [Oscillospiraceae bacterium]